MEKSDNSPEMQKQIIPMEGLIRFPERLNLAMKGMTNVELAGKTGLTEATIRNYRKGKSYPPLDKLKELADACNCPLGWLATGEPVTQIFVKTKLISMVKFASLRHGFQMRRK